MMTNNIIKLSLFRCLIVALVIVGFSYSGSLKAHPHSWIDIKTTILGRDKQITGLSMSWTFDDMTSMYILDDEDMSKKNKEATLLRLANDMLANMQRIHFMTYIAPEGQAHFALKTVGKTSLVQDGLQIILNFSLDLITPITVDEGVSLRIYDPSYYIGISWLSDRDVQLSKNFSAGCQVNVFAHQADAKQLAYAMALPADATADNDLGAQFTQKAEIRCQ